MSRDILLSLIDPDPEQPRKNFDPAKIAELAQSMDANGLAVPVLLRPVGDRYILVHGERRYRAALSLGWEAIPAEVRDVPPEEARWLSLVENIQRADLSPIEEARAYQERLGEGITQAELGRRVGKSQSQIAQLLRLLKLPDPLILFLDRKAITEGHARQLLKLKGIYTEDLTGEFIPEAFDPDTWERPLADAVMFSVIYARVEDQPPVPWRAFLPKDEAQAQLLADGCRAFRDYLARQNGNVPLWAAGAFWWAELVVLIDLSVADLAKALGEWRERFLSAVGWWAIRRTHEPPTGAKTPSQKIDQLAYWAYYSDLRHSGALEYIEARGVPRELEVDAMKFVLKNEQYTLPSGLQPWGQSHKEYMRLRDEAERASGLYSPWYDEEEADDSPADDYA